MIGEPMKKMNQLLALTGACALLLGANQLSAQDNTGDRPQRRQGGDNPGGGGGRGGNFDPAEMQQRIMDNVKEQLEVKDDTEWKALEPLVKKVMDTRRESMAFGVGGMMRGFGRGNRGGGGGGGGQGGGGDRPRNPFGMETPAEADALQKAIDAKASNADIKAAMAKYRDAKKAKEAAATKAQDELKKVLSVRQEAILVSNGTLN
jgi:hypothetical protein